MLRLALSRIAQAVPVLLVVSILSFLLLRAAPGNPALAQAGFNATPQVVAQISHRLGLDRPIYVQYWIWLKGVLHGNLGVSYSTFQPVTSLLGPEVPVTLEIGVISLIFTVVAGIPLGVWSALRKDRLFDQLTRVSSYTYVAIPNFVLALLCVLVFGLWVRNVWPYQGFVPLSQSIGSNLSHVLLPALCLALGPIGIVSRATRSSMLDVLGAEYVVAARALGVPRREIVWKYALRNALMPVVTILGLITGYVLSGAVLIETIFSLHGLGEQLYSSLNQRDYPVVIAIFMLGAVVFVLANLAVDLAYGVIDPRVRAGYAKRST